VQAETVTVFASSEAMRKDTRQALWRNPIAVVGHRNSQY
jgi:hypothetical protein